MFVSGMAKQSRKNTTWKILLFSLTGAVVVVLGYIAYQWIMEKRAHFMNYAAFGIEIPVAYSIHGIDVSKYQDQIDWGSVKDMKVGDVQMSFAFIKATEGLGNEDTYFRATKSGKAQAQNFINSVELLPGDLPPVLDIEQTYGVSPDKVRERAKE